MPAKEQATGIPELEDRVQFLGKHTSDRAASYRKSSFLSPYVEEIDCLSLCALYAFSRTEKVWKEGREGRREERKEGE